MEIWKRKYCRDCRGGALPLMLSRICRGHPDYFRRDADGAGQFRGLYDRLGMQDQRSLYIAIFSSESV